MSSRNTKQRFLSLFSVLLVAPCWFPLSQGVGVFVAQAEEPAAEAIACSGELPLVGKGPNGENRSLWRRCH